MKLQITGTTESFHVERGIGLALLAIAPDKIQPFVEPPRPIDTEVKWSIFGYPDKQLFLKVECPACHLGATLEAAVPFRHCGRIDEVPDELAATMHAHLAKRQPRRQNTPPMNNGGIGWLD